METDRTRRQADLEGLQTMARASGGRMQVSATPDLSEFTIQLRGVTAPVGTTEASYAIVEDHELRITLLDKYPDVMPKVSFLRPIYHPNCYTSGAYCHGDQWYPARRLDDFVGEMIRNMQAQGDLAFNPNSPANADAARFYRDGAKLAGLRRRLRPVNIVPQRQQPPASTLTSAGARVVGKSNTPVTPSTTAGGVRVVGKSSTQPQPVASIRRI